MKSESVGKARPRIRMGRLDKRDARVFAYAVGNLGEDKSGG